MNGPTPAGLKCSMRSVRLWQGPEKLKRDSRISCMPPHSSDTGTSPHHSRRTPAPRRSSQLMGAPLKGPLAVSLPQASVPPPSPARSTIYKRKKAVARDIRPQLKCTSVHCVPNLHKAIRSTKKRRTAILQNHPHPQTLLDKLLGILKNLKRQWTMSWTLSPRPVSLSKQVYILLIYCYTYKSHSAIVVAVIVILVKKIYVLIPFYCLQ